MNILEWFDPDNKEHIRAYSQMCNTGAWPEGFIDWDHIVFPRDWHTLLSFKLADNWVKYMLKRDEP